ncbi:hypothetical protein M406DRAFT_352436 [Cryphonectria parasitica EP155]|uniref:Uncharacterized protein n=1 Tax=Cryphonectria parasitica (strain ATCC 38755 / EP155) TaxID=660469 RepID=A0A9P4XYK8_CRYP1|nr:uncharacterized protein M406DRAFT_352436 [Cryphonectria parasitica EP155]KAF3763689.1 hypothetical protein M406DRAFT_352436 [Cryphonectria parasitica EP155]
MAHPENMTILLHKALEILNPKGQASHDPYSTLVSAAHAGRPRGCQRGIHDERVRGRKPNPVPDAVVPEPDKDFTYLVRREEAEVSWKGKYDPLKEWDGVPNYSRAALRKEASFWYKKVVDVRDKLKWMQKHLLEEMEGPRVSFGTRRNALVAMSQIRAMSLGIGATLMLIAHGELDKNRKDQNGTWAKGMKRLIWEAQQHDLNTATLMDILLAVGPGAARSLEAGDDESEDDDVLA